LRVPSSGTLSQNIVLDHRPALRHSFATPWSRLEHWDRFADLSRLTAPSLVMGARYDTRDPAYMAAMRQAPARGKASFPAKRQSPGHVRRPGSLFQRPAFL